MKFQSNFLSPERAKGASKLKLSILALSIALIASAASLSKAASFRAASQQPELVLDKTSVDYGEIFRGEELLTVFRVRNAGQQLLQISETPLLPSKQMVSLSSLEPARALVPVSASLLIPSPT